ncbi:nucleotide exchange factor GrpE [Candidatus Woesebacteria bacterium]|nr:nucleotide exchange factor GrpE [Candidatus Woesebacteria bacterium]
MTKKHVDPEVAEVQEAPAEVAVQASLDEVEQYKNLYLRALADYKNLEHRVNQERQRMRLAVKKQIIFELLPVLDNLDQAEVFTKDPGLQMISSSFRKALQELGVQEFELLGHEFDPEFAEAIEVVEGKKDNIIVDVVEKAYTLDGQVIRHGKVRVSRKPISS